MPESFNLQSNFNNEPNIIWSYINEDIFSGKLCGAIRLSNGNTLITESDFGLWEITYDGNIAGNTEKMRQQTLFGDLTTTHLSER